MTEDDLTYGGATWSRVAVEAAMSPAQRQTLLHRAARLVSLQTFHVSDVLTLLDSAAGTVALVDAWWDEHDSEVSEEDSYLYHAAVVAFVWGSAELGPWERLDLNGDVGVLPSLEEVRDLAERARAADVVAYASTDRSRATGSPEGPAGATESDGPTPGWVSPSGAPSGVTTARFVVELSAEGMPDRVAAADELADKLCALSDEDLPAWVSSVDGVDPEFG